LTCRGSWASPGQFRFTQDIENARAALAFLRDPANASHLGIDTLAGVTAESMADDLIANAKGYDFATTADGLAKLPVLVLSSNDGLAPPTDALVKALQTKGDKNVTAVDAETDHAWSDHRIFLEAQVIIWPATLRAD
jgi:uncharacterized protein